MGYRVNKSDIEEQEKRQIEKYGFIKWALSGRYGYYAVDEKPYPDTKEGRAHCVVRTYVSGLKKKDAYQLINALLED